MASGGEIVALRTFLTVYRTGGVGKAAEALHLSQPAVSHHLRALEATTERTLFVRSGRGISPTEAGHALAAEVEEHLDALDNALAAARPSTTAAHAPILLGAPADQLDRYLFPVLAPLLADGLVLHCRTGLSPELVDALLDDQLDIALATKIETAPARHLYLRHLFDEDFVLVGRPGEAPYSPGERPGRGFAGFSTAMPMARRYFRECWGVAPPSPALTVADVRATAAAAATGALLAVVPRFLVQGELDRGELVILHEPAQPVINSIYVATRRGRQNLPGIRNVLRHLQAAEPTT